MTSFTLRQILRHWRLNIAVLLCLTLVCALAASLSGYADTIAARELRRIWDGTSPSQHSLLITGPLSAFTEAMYVNLQEKLGKVITDRMEMRHATLIPDPLPSTDGINHQQAITILNVYSFDKLSKNVRVVDGKLPDMVNLRNAESWRPPPIEAVISVRAAAQSGYRIGDQLTASSQYHRLNIVGIVEPMDPGADIWGKDLSAFAPVTTTLPLIIDAYSMESFYPFRPIFPHEVSWRVTLNPQLITTNDAETLHSNLLNLQTQFATVHAVLDTGIAKILADYLAQLARLRTVLLLLTTQNLMVMLYALAMFAFSVARRSQAELAMLSGRGASTWQITRAFILVDLILSAIAVILGPVLVLGTMHLWAESAYGTPGIAMPIEAWILTGIIALLSWIVLILPFFFVALRDMLGEHRMGMQIPQQSAVQKHNVDLYLLAFGALLYWQLNQRDSLVMSRLGNTFLADPLLLIGPSLLLVGVAMTLLRVLPFLLQITGSLVQNLRGLVLSQSVFHLTRDSQHSSQVILLVSMISGLVLFAQILGNSMRNSPEPVVRYLADALQLNALALVLFSVTMFFLVHLFAAQGRACEFGILSTMGLSFHQWLTSLMTETVLVLFFGLMIGAVVGLSLSNIMIPYLAQTLTGWQIGVAIEQVSVDWAVVAQSYVLLITVYGLALVLLWIVLVHAREPWTVKIEDERWNPKPWCVVITWSRFIRSLNKKCSRCKD